MKVKMEYLSEKDRIEALDNLYTAAGAVHGRAAMKLFLRDLLTPSERIMLGRRIAIARRILLGTPVRQISRELKVGHDTIYKVERWLKDQLPGYEGAIAGLEKELEKREEQKLYATSALFRLKKKYPLHFLLFPLPKTKKPKRTV